MTLTTLPSLTTCTRPTFFALLLSLLCLDSANAFAGLQSLHHMIAAVHHHDPAAAAAAAAHHHHHHAATGGLLNHLNLPSLQHEIHDTAVVLQHSSAAFVKQLTHAYTNALQEHPLVTKMLTGGTLATAGDAIAQKTSQQSQQQQQNKHGDSSSNEQWYDTRRASSFMVFDMAYRALQHVSFPIIVQHCHGQYLNALLTTILAAATATATGAAATATAGHHHHHIQDPHQTMMTLSMLLHPATATAAAATTVAEQQQHLLSTDYLAAMEQTLASQLGIVPFLYYPVFFALTGAVQKLSPQAAWERAKDSFGPLMQRNLLFWIPVQFVQFGFIDEQLQIPFLSAAGLCWTFILSVYAGSTKQYSSSSSDNAEEAALPPAAVPDMSSEDDLVVVVGGEPTTSTSTSSADNRATVTL